ncbi:MULTISPECIES: MAPEG family protein [unclassified Pseudoalteromonas]|uniref:MAPEG family protein n=1 Tax=unclassified Pseudoalteromonas TaxID=194690 RepID=UPI00301561FE
MSVLIICAVLAVLLPYFAKVPVALEMNKLGGYDNKHPRQQQQELQGLGARAYAAHQNCFEALAVFAVALAVAFGTQTFTPLVEWLAISHIIARVVYCVLYWTNIDVLRSIVWVIGLGCAVAIIVVSGL